MEADPKIVPEPCHEREKDKFYPLCSAVQAIRICNAFERDFSLDLIVRTPKQIAQGFKENDWFLREIVKKGKVLYKHEQNAVD